MNFVLNPFARDPSSLCLDATMSETRVVVKVPKEYLLQLREISTWFQQNGAFHHRQLPGLDEWVDPNECLKKAGAPNYKVLGNALLQLGKMVRADCNISTVS